ncbi:MAG TPA: alpha/beta fold hydrolase [Pyrinomonadaceae bacterium]
MSPVRTVSPWFSCGRTDAQTRLRMFCFPYAGGGAAIYRGWENYVPPGVEILAIQPPGRGNRFREPAFDRMDHLVAAAATAMEPFLDLPIVLFGHSVGAMASFELAHRIGYQFGVKVLHLFVSGARAPQLRRNRHNIHDLPEDEFTTELKTLNGTPPEVLENPELMRMISKTLRADFAIAETYSCSHAEPLNCPITVMGGLDDTLAAREDLEAWRIHTTNSFDLWQLPGDHFFIHTSDSLILRIVSRELTRLINKD